MREVRFAPPIQREPVNRYNEEVWLSHRDLIRHLYLDLDWSFQRVKAYMASEKDFRPSQRSYYRYLDKWNIKKTMIGGSFPFDPLSSDASIIPHAGPSQSGETETATGPKLLEILATMPQDRTYASMMTPERTALDEYIDVTDSKGCRVQEGNVLKEAIQINGDPSAMLSQLSCSLDTILSVANRIHRREKKGSSVHTGSSGSPGHFWNFHAREAESSGPLPEADYQRDLEALFGNMSQVGKGPPDIATVDGFFGDPILSEQSE